MVSPRVPIAVAPALRMRYAERLPADAAARCLATFAYGRTREAAALALPLATGDGALAFECWETDRPVTRTEGFGASLAEDGQLLVAAWRLDEAALGGLEAASAHAYQRIAELTARSGYPHPVKIWHYFGAINEGSGDDERYRRFCVGRARGLVPGQPLPAATAVGLQAPAQALHVLLLAAREPGIRIENPRQVPAFEYPRAYGPVSPSFSRAMLMPWGQLFVSGTAAVVGHASCHPDNARAQLRELSLNLDALVARAESISAQRLRPSAIKLYVRRAEDLPPIEALAAQMFPGDCARLAVRADISRAELQVEVEALYDPVARD